MSFIWETLSDARISRAKIFGGWLVRYDITGKFSITFVPDPNHEWDGTSLS